MVPDTETSIGVTFLDSLQMNPFMHRDRDENIKCKAYFADFGHSESVYFTKNKTSNKQVFIQIIWPKCHINRMQVFKLLFNLGKIGLLVDKS